MKSIKNKAKSKYYKKQFEKYKDCSKRQWTIINDLLKRKTKNHYTIKVKEKKGNLLSFREETALLKAIASTNKNKEIIKV